MLAVVGVLVVVFLSAVDATIVSTAMPKVVAAIGGMDLYPWVFSSFMLTSTIATPFYGKFADVYGVRRCMFVAIAVFLAGSALCGASQTMLQLVLARAVQGIGAGGTMVLAMIAFGTLFPPETRGRAQGLLSMVWGISSLVGPMTGGLMVAHLPWPWIFWINLPVGAVAAALIYRAFPRAEATHRPHRFDWLGAVLLVVGLTALMLALTAHDPLTRLGWPVGIVALAAFGWWQTRAPEPLVPLTPFSNRTFLVSAILGVGSCLTMFAALNYTPLLVQGGLGRSAPEAAMVLTPMMLSWPIASATAGALLNRWGFRKLVVLGAALQLAAYALLAVPAWHEPLWLLGLEAAILGAGMGFLTSTTMVAAQVAVPTRLIGTASSSLGLSRNVGGSLGLNLMGGLQLSVFFAEVSRRAPELAPAQAALLREPQRAMERIGSGELSGAALEVFRGAMGASVTQIFVVSIAIAALVLIASWWMPPLTPRQAADLAKE